MSQPKQQKKQCGCGNPTCPVCFPGGVPKNFPGITPPAPSFDFNSEYQREFEGMQERCYRLLHRPNAVKIIGFRGAIYYICPKCLDRYMKKHEELKKVVVRFSR